MYVLSSMPANKQSIAGSLLQTLTRLCTAVGYGIATAIFDAVEKNPPKSGYYASNAVAPFAGVFWFAVGVCFIAVLFIPFLRITTQGHKGDTGQVKQANAANSSPDLEKFHAGILEEDKEKVASPAYGVPDLDKKEEKKEDVKLVGPLMSLSTSLKSV
jgi:hypothetical protein